MQYSYHNNFFFDKLQRYIFESHIAVEILAAVFTVTHKNFLFGTRRRYNFPEHKEFLLIEHFFATTSPLI